MLLSIGALRILTEFDDIIAKWYLEFIVKCTPDGSDLLKHQGFYKD